ncbi:MAG: hypothetical protein WAP36_06945 [Halanaerobiales bacterium]|jgi:hypothetical protein|nr:hypothetical protein [Halanaerobiales bacterium]HPZ62035.1 hypothetical protein [Halanaerobiales bacterium]HQD03241.1 hypothetical protein [Halanaerobiales bacterium]
MSDERVRVLKLLENGEIDVGEAIGLLNALDSQTEEKGKKNKIIRIIVAEDGEEKVNIRVPIRLAKLLTRFIPKSVLEDLGDEDIDLKELLESLEWESVEGELLNVNDDGDIVIIRVE